MTTYASEINAKNQYTAISSIFNKTPRSPIGQPDSTLTLVHDDDLDAAYFRTLESGGFRLNRNQLEAVRTTIGPVLINAGAGSGKTSTIVARTGYLLAVEKVPGSKILLVTFTQKAAFEMKNRVKNLPGLSGSSLNGLTIGTFHSIFLRMLRENGVNKEILSSERQQQYIIKQIMKQMNLADSYDTEVLLSLISYYKNNMHTPDMLEAKTDVQKECKEIYSRYEQWKDNENMMDFDDVLLVCLQMLDWQPGLLKRYQQKIDYIICDESQDTSPVQYEILKRIAAKNDSPNFCLVGDINQTLYRFRSAEPKYMLNFSKEFKYARQIDLDINYRSIDSIVGLGNLIIKQSKQQLGLTLHSVKQSKIVPAIVLPQDEEEEAELIVQQIIRKRDAGQSFKDMAILYRSHANSRAVVDRLVMHKVPFILHGRKNNNFYQQSFIKPVLDLLRLSLDAGNEEALTGAASILYLKREMVKQVLSTLNRSSYLKQRYETKKMGFVFSELSKSMGEYQRKQMENKFALIESLKNLEPLNSIRLIRNGIIGYDKMLEMDDKKTLTLHKEILIEMLDTLEQSARGFKKVSEYISFVDRVVETSSQMDEIKKIPHYDAVHLMTIHASKGLEYDSIFLIGVVEGVLPHKSSFTADSQNDRITQRASGNYVQEEALEDELRLLYVGITRAERNLYISSPKMYQDKERKISRFLIDAFQDKSKGEGRLL